MNSQSLSLGPNSPTLIINENALVAGGTYRLRLVARYERWSQLTKSAGELTGSSEIEIRASRVPQAGQLRISPPNGTLFTTNFEISANNWIDFEESLPLLFK